MKIVIQRVLEAKVEVDGAVCGQIGEGYLLLLGVSNDDTKEIADKMIEKVSRLRIFKDNEDKINLSIGQIDGEVLVVSNFTLNANYSHGNRPDYFGGAVPDEANRLYECFLKEISSKVRKCESGKFGADMLTEMTTDGPVTIVMNSKMLYTNKN